MRSAAKVAVAVVFVSVVGGQILEDEMGATFEEALIGPLTGPDLVHGGIILGVSVITLWIVDDGVRALLTGVRIFLRTPISAEEAYLQDDVIEIQGTAEPIEGVGTIRGKYSGIECLAYSWKEKRTESKTNDSKKGFSSTRTGKRAVPFYVTDDTGKVAVDPEGATLSVRRSLQNRDWSYRYVTRTYEGRIRPGDTVHVYGPKQEATTANSAPGDRRIYVGDGDDVSGTYKISDTTANRTALRSLVRGAVYLITGGLFFAFTVGTL